MPDNSHSDPSSVNEVLDAVIEQTEGKEDATIKDVLEAFDGRAYGPLLMIPALVVITPIGAIPAVPTMMGLFTIFVAAQAVFNKSHPWVPGFITARGVERDTLEDSFENMRGWAKWFDKLTKRRMTWLVDPPGEQVMAALCVLVACTLPPLEFIPFAGAAAGLAIGCFAIGFLARDGLFALFGILATIGCGGFVWFAIGKVFGG
jgi:hypothetical protein